MADPQAETSMALGARLDFVADALREYSVKTVLDIGSGTGEALTAPLARRLPDMTFLGVDSDAASHAYAVEKFKSLANASWSLDIPAGATFDAVIASEVIEHVTDPARFLETLKTFMGPDSILIVTLPNGYGCHEMMSFLEVLLQLSGIIPLAKRLFKKNSPRADSPASPETLAVSPHINFLSHRKALQLFRNVGFQSSAYQGRMFLCSFIMSMIIDRSPRLVVWNIQLGRRLPAVLVADWMFVLKKDTNQTAAAPSSYRRDFNERLRMRLNCRSCGIPAPE